MFGLMKPENACSHKHTNNYRYHRMHYCGTCKTLGQEYGQQTRLMLNFDTVFLSEILSHLSNENLATWQDGFQAINKCFTMPDKSENAPLSLQYAAATNIILGELKVDDNIKDARNFNWKFLRLLLSKPFRKANKQFKNWGLDTDNLWYWIKKQDEIENGAVPKNHSLTELLAYYAEPTAQITASIFEQGASTVGQSTYGNEMRQLGYQFGRLVYILDAFEDVEKDIFNHQFNPLTHFYNIKETLTNTQLTEVRQLVVAYQSEVAQQITQLPFSEDIIEHYSVRLYSNITDRIYKNRQIPMRLDTKIQTSILGTIQKTKEVIWSNLASLRNANYYLVSMVLFVIPMAVDFLSFNNEAEIYKWSLVFTAVLAGLGLMQNFARKGKHRKATQFIKKVVNGEQKLRFSMILGAFSKRNGCCSECCSECCSCCCQSICDSVCDSICDGESESGDESESESENESEEL